MLNATRKKLDTALSRWQAARWRKIADRRLALRREVNRVWINHDVIKVERHQHKCSLCYRYAPLSDNSSVCETCKRKTGDALPYAHPDDSEHTPEFAAQLRRDRAKEDTP